MAGKLSPLLLFSVEKLHVLLPVMLALYVLRLSMIFRRPAARDRQSPTGSQATSALKGAGWSLLAVAMPGRMPSLRTNRFFYIQFLALHAGIAVTMATSYIFTYRPDLLAPPAVSVAVRLFVLAGLTAGGLRMYRRLFDIYVRAISTPDDYFTLALVLVWMALCLIAVGEAPAFAAASGFTSNPTVGNLHEIPVVAFFILTGFLHIYAPFSKIFHYVYYPFSRWYLGKSLGHRGVFPLQNHRAP